MDIEIDLINVPPITFSKIDSVLLNPSETSNDYYIHNSMNSSNTNKN